MFKSLKTNKKASIFSSDISKMSDEYLFSQKSIKAKLSIYFG